MVGDRSPEALRAELERITEELDALHLHQAAAYASMALDCLARGARSSAPPERARSAPFPREEDPMLPLSLPPPQAA